jgi:hypothetical protein
MAWGRVHWISHGGKHRPNQKIAWERQVELTANEDYPAKYKPGVPIRQLEESVVERWPEMENEHSPIVLKRGRSVLPVGDWTKVYMICDDEIGASNGHSTDIVIVQWDQEPTGCLHGRPISERELIELLRRKNPNELAEYHRLRGELRRAP